MWIRIGCIVDPYPGSGSVSTIQDPDPDVDPESGGKQLPESQITIFKPTYVNLKNTVQFVLYQ